MSVTIQVGAKRVEASIQKSQLPRSNVPVYLIDQPRYFDRDGIYGAAGNDYEDNCERFIFFNRAVLEAMRILQLRPDVVHCNDWQTGLIPVYLKTHYNGLPEFQSVGTLLTIHNLAYLGLFWHWDMALTGLDWHLFNWRQLEFHGKLCFMKAGLVFADMLSTVSPTYAREIQTPKFGSGLDGLLRERHADLRGIVNGIDTEVWSPSHEMMLAERYDESNMVRGKAKCKAWLQRRAGLTERPDVPVVRADRAARPPKGVGPPGGVWPIFCWNATCNGWFWARDIPNITPCSRISARRYPGKFWAYQGFSEDLAHQIEAGADLFLMPSLFEPCGLNQLYSLAHGTVPMVRATGGLADTVVDANPSRSPTVRPTASPSPKQARKHSGTQSSGRWRHGPTATPG